MANFNKEQLRAIQTKRKNITVSASAGSGKTTVLIARLMDLVLVDRVEIESILAMTFTEAAANEMKKRLASSLQEAYLKSDDEDEKRYITKQLTNIQTAHISTIHSFCLSIIQEYYYVIGLDPQRIGNIMDNAMMSKLQNQALETAFELQYEKQDKSFLSLCVMFSARNEDDNQLRNLISSLALLASAQPNPDTWLINLVNAYDKDCVIDLPSAIVDNFFDYLYVCTLRYDECIDRLMQLYSHRYYEEEKKAAIVANKLAHCKELYTHIKERNYKMFLLTLQSVAHAIVPTSPDKEDVEYNTLRKNCVDIEDTLFKTLFSEDTFMRDLKSLQPAVLKIIEMVQTYRNTYAALKEEHKMIDFDDMEHFALRILTCNDGAVAKLYREQFAEIMVDEFQDSNEIQNSLVMLIARENNVFRVGDIKQSIYKFRHAKPQIMRNIIDHQGAFDEVIYLSNNYRSKKMVVDFNNILFESLMNLDHLGCSYTAQDNVEIGIEEQAIDNYPIVFHALFADDIKELIDDYPSKNEIKASYITHEIKRMHDTERRKWKDFVVLTRNNARKEDMKKAFDKLNIPYFIDVQTGFYQSSSVQLMLSALAAILDPNDDIAFIATLTSPLFHVSAAELANIKIKKREWTQLQNKTSDEKVYEPSYYGYLCNFSTPFFEAFKQLRFACLHQPITQTLNNLFNVNDYYTSHTTEQQKTNLDLLFEKACRFEEEQSSGIHEFLSTIDQIKDAKTGEAIPIGSQADVVRVMSIHQSKGLQFPVVFLWSMDKMSSIEFNDFCIKDSELGLAMKKVELPKRFTRTTLPRIALEQKIIREDLEEEMRILYVATTRAQQQMHIVDTVSDLKLYQHPLTTASIYERKGYTSWILQYFLNHPSSIFTLKEVHTPWEDEKVPRKYSSKQAILTYAYPDKEVQFITATQPKKEEIKIHLDVSKGSQYGTKMHKMVELLSNADWDEKTIKDIAKTIDFNLHHYDIERLQKLDHNDIFQQARTHSCFFELPFVVKDKDDVLHGYMDFVSMHDDEIIIMDFKTDRLDGEDDFINTYQKQLALYRKAMHILYPDKTIHTYIYSFHLSSMIVVDE